MIDCVKEAPAPVLEIVSDGADETTDVSVVGKFPDTAVPFALTPGLAEAAGALVVEETTDASSVAKCVAALAAGELEGRAPSRPSLGADATEGLPPFCGGACSPAPFAFSIAACWSFTCCCNVFTLSVSACTC